MVAQVPGSLATRVMEGEELVAGIRGKIRRKAGPESWSFILLLGAWIEIVLFLSPAVPRFWPPRIDGETLACPAPHCLGPFWQEPLVLATD